MSLVNLIASQAASALTLMKQYVLNPSLVCPNGITVPLKTHHYRFSGDAVVSKRVVIDLTQGKKTTTDNIAPGPREWDIEAHVGGMPGELSSRFMPSIGAFRDALEGAWSGRQQVTFFDKYQKSWQVVVEHFEYEPDPTEENALLVRIHLVELNVQTVSVSGVAYDPQMASAIAADGTTSGAPKALGTSENAVQTTDSTTSQSVLSIPGAAY